MCVKIFIYTNDISVVFRVLTRILYGRYHLYSNHFKSINVIKQSFNSLKVSLRETHNLNYVRMRFYLRVVYLFT